MDTTKMLHFDLYKNNLYEIPLKFRPKTASLGFKALNTS